MLYSEDLIAMDIQNCICQKYLRLTVLLPLKTIQKMQWVSQNVNGGTDGGAEGLFKGEIEPSGRGLQQLLELQEFVIVLF